MVADFEDHASEFSNYHRRDCRKERMLAMMYPASFALATSPHIIEYLNSHANEQRGTASWNKMSSMGPDHDLESYGSSSFPNLRRSVHDCCRIDENRDSRGEKQHSDQKQ